VTSYLTCFGLRTRLLWVFCCSLSLLLNLVGLSERMARCMKGWLAMIGVVAVSTSTLASPTPTTNPLSNTSFLNCATKTITTTSSTCAPLTQTNCLIPECIFLSTIYLNCDCPTVGLVFTDTVFIPCTTTCDSGCATAYQTVATPCPTSPPAVSSSPELCTPEDCS